MTSNTHASRKRILIPILLTCFGYFCYNLSDAGTKDLLSPQGGNLHWAQVMLTTNATILVFMAFYGWRKDGKKAFRTNKPGLMFLRGVLGQVSTLCNMFAFPHVQLTTFYTLIFTSPFCVALLSAWFFKDKLDSRRLGVILFGFCVILYIFRPGSSLLDVWALLILGNAVSYSCQMLVVRQIGPNESRPLIYMVGCVMSMLIAIPFLGDHYIPLTMHEWPIFAGVGLVNTVGMLALSYAFQVAPSASTVAPYHYTQIIWGALLGYYIFGEVPNGETMVGAVLLILSGLYLIRHETRKAALKPAEV